VHSVRYRWTDDICAAKKKRPGCCFPPPPGPPRSASAVCARPAAAAAAAGWEGGRGGTWPFGGLHMEGLAPADARWHRHRDLHRHRHLAGRRGHRGPAEALLAGAELLPDRSTERPAAPAGLPPTPG
jgi:hypothetical protein